MNMLSPLRMVPLGEIAAIDRQSVAPEAIPAGTRYLGLEHIEAGGRILEAPTVLEGDLASMKFAFGPITFYTGSLDLTREDRIAGLRGRVQY